MPYYMDPAPNPSGAYPNLKCQPFPEGIQLTEEQAELFHQYNGFVTLSKGADGESVLTPNTEAWEAWKDSLPPEPEPAPTVEELQAKIAALTTSNQMLEDCLVEMAGVIYA